MEPPDHRGRGWYRCVMAGLGGDARLREGTRRAVSPMEGRMRRRRPGLTRRTPIAIVASFAVLAALLAPAPVGAWDYSSPKTDYLAEEAMRLINLNRKGTGRATLFADTKLLNLARDLLWTCPTNSSLSMRGRTRDMIDRAYFSHSIKDCYKSGSTLFSIIDILANPFGYKNGRAEIIGHNYTSVAATSYRWGCNSSGGNCNGTTTTPATVASMVTWWMNSSSHRGIIFGDYDRFGCGVWRGDGKKLYTCLFAKGGPHPLDKTAPTVLSATGDGASVAQGSSITLSAEVSDNFRLADGWVRLDASSSCRGTTIHAWAYNLNVVTNTHSFTWDTTGVPKGTHAVGWRVRDVATLKSACFRITIEVT